MSAFANPRRTPVHIHPIGRVARSGPPRWEAPRDCADSPRGARRGDSYASPARIDYRVPDSAHRPRHGGHFAGGAPIRQLNIVLVYPGLFKVNSARFGRGPGGADARRADGVRAGGCAAPIGLGDESEQAVSSSTRGLNSAKDVTAADRWRAAQVLQADRQSPGLDQINVVIPRTMAGRGQGGRHRHRRRQALESCLW